MSVCKVGIVLCRIKFTPDLQTQQQSQRSITQSDRGGVGGGDRDQVGSNLVKTTIELGSSGDPLAVSSSTSITPSKPKFKSSSATILENPSAITKPVVEMSDKAVMTSQLPEQWSLVSSNGSDNRRISLGATSPPGNSPPPAPTLSGGVPDLLPTCVVRHGAEYQSNNPW